MLWNLRVPRADKVHEAAEIQKDFLEQTASWRAALGTKASLHQMYVLFLSSVTRCLSYWQRPSDLEGCGRSAGASSALYTRSSLLDSLPQRTRPPELWNQMGWSERVCVTQPSELPFLPHWALQCIVNKAPKEQTVYQQKLPGNWRDPMKTPILSEGRGTPFHDATMVDRCRTFVHTHRMYNTKSEV